MVEETFAEGFRQGFRAIRGSSAVMPVIPVAPATRVGRTSFQMGLLRGIERGKRWDKNALRDMP